MGCKGSKHKSAASDIAVSPRKKSEVLMDKPAPDPDVVPAIEVAAAGSVPVIEIAAAGSVPVIEVTTAGSVPVIEVTTAGSDSMQEVKDITASTELSEKPMAEEERQVGKLISLESPDQYFTPGKEEERINTIAAEGGEYYSPRCEPGRGGKKEEDSLFPKAVEEGQQENIQPCRQEKENAASKEDANAGKSDKEELEVKEHILNENTAKVTQAVGDQTTHVDTEVPQERERSYSSGTSSHKIVSLDK